VRCHSLRRFAQKALARCLLPWFSVPTPLPLFDLNSACEPPCLSRQDGSRSFSALRGASGQLSPLRPRRQWLATRTTRFFFSPSHSAPIGPKASPSRHPAFVGWRGRLRAGSLGDGGPERWANESRPARYSHTAKRCFVNPAKALEWLWQFNDNGNIVCSAGPDANTGKWRTNASTLYQLAGSPRLQPHGAKEQHAVAELRRRRTAGVQANTELGARCKTAAPRTGSRHRFFFNS
jgi:hypothetical protein